MPYRKQLEKLITETLRDKGLTYDAAGKLTDLNPSTVLAAKRGQARSRETLVKLAHGLGIPLKTILAAAEMEAGPMPTRAELSREVEDIAKRLQELASLVLEAE